MSASYKFYVEARDYNYRSRLFVSRDDGERRDMVKTLVLENVSDGVFYDTPTLDGRTDEVRAFLQGALDAAWDMGLRPLAYADHTNELKAVRYHLEDMRALAKVPQR